MRTRRWVLLAAVLGPLCGCYTVKYETKKPAAGHVFEEREQFFLCGLVGDANVDLQRVCPDGVARWQNQATFVDGLFTCLTCGIYSPRTVHVECQGGRAFELTKDPSTGQMCARSVAPSTEVVR